MDDFKQIDIEKANEMIVKGGVTIVDVRDPGAYAEAHIRDAVSLSSENIDQFMKEADKEKPLICYCYHGFSSQGAAHFLKQNGFKEVYSVDGGFEAYRKAYPA